jgi:hypothetical protein
MPKLVNRPSEEEIKAANEKHDKRDAPETRWYYRGDGKPGRDYSEAHQRRLAELKRKADPACPCGQKTRRGPSPPEQSRFLFLINVSVSAAFN